MHDLRFVDLFAGIGGFHQALGPAGLGMTCVFASEIDQHAADVYEWNHGMRPAGSCYVCEGCGSTSGCS